MKIKILNVWLLIYAILTTSTLFTLPMNNPYIVGLSVVLGPVSLIIMCRNIYLRNKRKDHASKMNSSSGKLTAIIVLIISNNCCAQTNLSFEKWSMGPLGILEPDGWQTMNALAFNGTDSISCIPVTDAVHAKLSVKLRSIETSATGTKLVLPGFITQQFVSGSKHKSLRFSYKAIGSSRDSFYATIAYYKGSVKLSNIVGSASVILFPVSNWTTQELPISWSSPNGYDTAIVGFGTARNTSAELLIDNVDLSENGVQTEFITKSEKPYVVVQNLLVFSESMNAATKKVLIYNASGQLVMESGIADVNVANFYSGTYFLLLVGESGKTIYSDKFYKE